MRQLLKKAVFEIVWRLQFRRILPEKTTGKYQNLKNTGSPQLPRLAGSGFSLIHFRSGVWSAAWLDWIKRIC